MSHNAKIVEIARRQEDRAGAYESSNPVKVASSVDKWFRKKVAGKFSGYEGGGASCCSVFLLRHSSLPRLESPSLFTDKMPRHTSHRNLPPVPPPSAKKKGAYQEREERVERASLPSMIEPGRRGGSAVGRD